MGKKKTDLNRVKEVATTFLYLDISKTHFSPIVVQHPFFDSGIVMVKGEDGKGRIGNIVESQADLRLAREMMRQRINEANSVSALGVLITKPYRLAFLKFIKNYTSAVDIGTYLASIWTSIECINMDVDVTKNEIIGLFKRADRQALMTETEREVIDTWDSSLPIYRGITEYNHKQIRGLSWTLSIRTARYFANRYNTGGTVYQAYIDKENILAHIKSRSEEELVVDHRALYNIKAIEEIKPSGEIIQTNTKYAGG